MLHWIKFVSKFYKPFTLKPIIHIFYIMSMHWPSWNIYIYIILTCQCTAVLFFKTSKVASFLSFRIYGRKENPQ